ncbi:non-ribosomal peptide synthetase [Amycolatopsis aidingensis]|uniref:non-ribosomal peptide synthetase n=1 Tax=Amycolatopsis aidingensis TaxID=2842453 RepID=UPI001C0CD1EF|nr:non-ribosomal peptide synthetase [Amycolatopsis aidingensis]
MADSRQDRERGPEAGYRPDRMWRLIAGVLAEGGERVAAVCGQRSLSHAELDGRSAALAERLRAAGAGPERPVAVLVEDGLDLLVACLAVFRAGGVYLPVDPAWPAGRRAAVLSDARPVAAVVSGAAPPVEVPTVPVEAGTAGPGRWPEPEPDQAAYLMYTSGSTGRPKGVLATHGGLANRMLWWQRAYPLRQEDVLLATASPGFDIAVWELLAGLLAGARLVLAEHRVHGIVPYLQELMAAERVTVAHLVPSVLAELLAGMTDGDRLGLRLAVCGGEAVPPSLRDRLLSRSDARLVHAYGPTEATITVVHDECLPGEPADVVPLGRQMPGATVAIVDTEGRPVPDGAAGELLLGGAALARGYLGRPAETASRFVPDWLGLGPAGGRLYRTGDRARRLPDGRILFLGRLDDQFKVRGHRVDPAELESLLHQHPAVRRAAVRLAGSGNGAGQQVVAYVQGGAEPAQLRAHLADRVAQAVIPTRWVFLDRFPLTPNGKVDHAALPEPPRQAEQPREEAGTELERELCALWADLLGLGSVGVADDFFALGGHSLIATRTVATVWQRHRVRLSLADVLRARTVAELAKRVEKLAAAEHHPRHQPVGAAADQLPLSHAQARILFEEEFLGGPGLFSVPVLTRWQGPVDEPALRAALDGLVRRHPVLRAALAEDAEPARLVVGPAAEVPLAREDLRGLDPAARAARVAEAAEEMLAEPFDLSRPPLLRARLARLAEQEHVFLLVLHHLVCDRWSMQVLTDDLHELYAAARARRAPRLDPPAHPAAALTRPDEAETERILDYWIRRLDGVALDTDLMVGRRHRKDNGHRAGRALRLLSSGQAAALSGLCAEHGVTPFMVLLAAFQVLLHRFSGADDLVVGAPVADRDLPGAENVVSMLVHTLPLRADLRGNPRFAEVLDQCRESVLAAHQHQAVPIERLAGALGRRRGSGHHPLMRYLVVWEDSPGPPVRLPGVTAEPMRPCARTTAFDLTLIARAWAGEIDLELEFNQDTLDTTAAETLAEALTAMLADFLADPRLRIGAARLAEGAPPAGLLGPVRPQAPGLVGLVRTAAAQRQGAAAVLAGSTVTSYAELLREADAVAARIRAAGGRTGDVVGVCLPRSTALVATLLGVLQAGCAFLPLSTADPDERVARQLEISGARWVITAETGRFAGLGVPVLPAEQESTVDALDSGPWPEPGQDDPAYVIFTSGSTGEPKGVVVEHGALADHVRWAISEYRLSPADRALQFCSVTFDVLLEELFPTLAAGATVVLREQEAATSAQALLAQCAASGVTVLNLPTGYWERLTDALAEDGLAWPDPVRLMVIGGQQADLAAVRRWHRHVPGVRLLNAYGPTEVTIGATVAELRPDAAVPIGGPIPNTRAYLLDRYLAPVPEGAVAELYLAGSGVARGYAGHPGLTAQRFLPDPFACTRGARMYRTGDLAYRRDGALYFVGRADRQVKVRGYRIELDEVERALTALPLVDEAAVLAREDHLEAHVATRSGVDGQAVRAELAARLPAFMVPSVLAVAPALPKTATGKVDRAALAPVPVEQAADFQPPRDDRERAACALWAEVLGVSRVGVRDSFFALGGHSLLAMDLVRRMRRQGYPQLRMPDLFEHPTIEALAPWAAAESGAEPEVAKAAPPSRAPLSWAQLGIWAQAATTEAGTFHLPVLLRLSGPLAEPVLRAAIEALTARHDLLRSVLEEGTEDGTEEDDQAGPCWRAAEGTPAALRVLDLPAAELDARVRDLVAEPFDLTAAPPVRWTLLRLGETEHALLVVLHHIAADGWSAGGLVRELGELYAAHADHRPAGLDPAPSFLALAAADRAAPPDEAGLAFWAEALRGAPDRMELPAERIPGTLRDSGRHRARLPLPGRAAAALEELARRERATLFITLLAGVQAWLARCCGQREVLVGTPVADRDDPTTAGVVGPLVNVLPLRADVDPAGSFADQLARTRATVLAAFEHRSVPTQRIVRQLGLSGRGLSQVVFDLDDAATPETVPFGQLKARTVPLTPALGAFDLEVTARRTPEGLDVELRGAADMFEQTGIEHLASALARLLTGVAQQPGAPLGTIELLDERERHRLLVEPNRRTLPQRPAEVPGLVAEWVARTPDATAVSTSGGSLSYRELDALAEGVAAWLREHGLPVEGPVATRMGRCRELPAVVLGIWKAGGVYVPLDPGHPDERHQRILADCRPHAVLTDGPGPDTGPVPALDIAELRPAVAGTGVRSHHPEPDQLAYVAYTSGSTGTPKGVQCTQRGLANQLLWSRQAYPLRPGAALAQVAAVGFDISLWEMFHPLASGGRLVVLDQDRHGDVPAIADLVATERVAVLHLVPTLLEHYLDQRTADCLRHVVCGGEGPSPGLPARFAARMSATLHHTYGPTEASIIATHWQAPADPEPGRVPLGGPLPNARVYLLDPEGLPVPAGVVGELVLGGEVLARGYLGQPAATAERFLPDPFAGVPGARMYRTGDLARYRSDGSLEFVGRADRQVKIAGVRVEPREVEAAIGADPRVAACAVLPRRDPAGVASLVGYLVPADPAADPDGLCAELRAALRERLPRAMVPAQLLPLAELPLGVNGKLDVAALPAPEPRAEPEPDLEPGTGAERTLAAIWSQVVPAAGGRHISPRDNFFDLGGDSVSAIRVVARARAAGLRIELGQVLRAATLAELAASAVPAGEPTAPALPDSDGRLWFTPAQRRFLATAGRAPGHLNQAVLTEPTERVEPEPLRAALRAVATHHEAFRLRAAWDGQRWREHADLAGQADPLVTVLVAAEPYTEDSAARLARPAHEAMDIEHGPLLAALLAEREDRGQVVLLVAHHLAVDTASWEIVLSDLDTAYRQVSRGEPVRLPQPATPFADFARALPGLAARLDTPGQREYWRGQLADLPLLPATAGDDGDPEPVTLALGAQATTALLAATSRHRLRVDELLLAGLARVIARWTGQRRVAVLRETHGRSGPPGWADLTGTVGWFTAVHPLLIEMSTVDDSLAALRATRGALAAVPDGGVGYGLLRADTGPEPELAVNYLGSTAGGGGQGLFSRAERQAVGADAAAEHATPRGIELLAGIDGRGLWLEWLYDTGRFARHTMLGLAGELRTELADLVSALDGPFGLASVPADFPAVDLPGEQLRAVLTSRPGTGAVLPLSPAQQGMLAWHLAHPESGAYHTQLLFEVEGEVDEAALRWAWKQVVAHTDVFRAAFPTAGLDEPVQVIGPAPEPDWRRHTGSAADLDAVLAADRAERFDLAEPGAQRWHWVDGGTAGRWLLWSHHHILLDGWSLPLVLAEVARAYTARTAGRAWTPPNRPGYAAYLSWLSTQDEEAGQRFWRATLAGATPTRIGRAGKGGSAALATAELSPAATAELTRLAERSRTTLHSVVLAGWSLLLGQRCASQDLVFGVVMSLRPEEVTGAEQLVGLCLNTVPLRVRVDTDGELTALFGQVQQALVEAYQHAAHPPSRIRTWSGAADALFDSIVVFENYPGDRTGQALGEHGRLRVVRAVESTEFAVSLTVLPGERLTFELTYADHALTTAEADGLLRRLTRLLERIADSP